jgi:hypothetical protein
MNCDNDETLLTPEDQNRLAWCYSMLDEEQIAEAEAEAFEIASKEANAPHAYELLVELLAEIMLARLQAEMNEGGNERRDAI